MRISRRSILAGAVLGTGARAWAGQAPGQIRREGARPGHPSGVQCGDVTRDSAVIWGRTDRPARMRVEWSTSEDFRSPRVVAGPAGLEITDHTGKVVLTDLPAGEPVFYRVQWEDLREPGVWSEPLAGRLRTAPDRARDVLVTWSGDVCGQGWGIDTARGGMKGWETIRALDPDLFIHSGDVIYADNPVAAEVKLEDGTLWKNLVTPEKSKVAETLAEFRGNYAYNLLDENLRRFSSQVPVLFQWDDHETLNNWYPHEILADPRYQEKSVDLIAARARRAFLEYTPLRPSPEDPERIYRSYSYGPSLEVFLLDCRSYRGPNTPNRQTQAGPETEFLGSRQVDWLKKRLRASRATWKLIACDMPIGLVVGDTGGNFEAVAQGNGPALGRELEIAGLLRFIRDQKVRNTVWVTADVHYAAAHYYDPSRARFQEFLPFWEFVAGPLHAGTFGPGTLDDTFGPQLKFSAIPPGTRGNRPPSDGLQFFGALRIDGKTEVLTASLRNTAGQVLYQVDLNPER